MRIKDAPGKWISSSAASTEEESIKVNGEYLFDVKHQKEVTQ
jgi:hypothetical protein